MRDKIERGLAIGQIFRSFLLTFYSGNILMQNYHTNSKSLYNYVGDAYLRSQLHGWTFFFASPSLCADSNCENRKIKESRGKNRADTPQLSGSFPSFLFFAPSSFLSFSFSSPFLQGCQFCGDTVVSLPLSLTLEPLLRRTSFTQLYSPCRAMSINGWSILNQTVLSATQKNLTFDNSRNLNS